MITTTQPVTPKAWAGALTQLAQEFPHTQLSIISPDSTAASRAKLALYLSRNESGYK